MRRHKGQDSQGHTHDESCGQTSRGHDHGDNHGHDHGHDHGHGRGSEKGHMHGHNHGHHHGHSHGHGHFHAHDLARGGNKAGLVFALLITSGIMLLEFFGGLLTGSLALLSDSGHMLNDAGSLLLSLVAMALAARAATSAKTFGYYRFEILAALFNGVTLFAIAGFILWEAFQRFQNPPEVASGSMMLIAAVGLLANLASAWALMRKGDVKNNLNIRSAYLHVLGDALGSLGAIAAGIVMQWFGWYVADPIISVLVSLLILKGAWGVIRSTLHILMEGAPETVGREEVHTALQDIRGVRNVHDLHLWTITSGLDSMTCHLLVEEDHDSQGILQQAVRLLEERFGIRHATIQIETDGIRHAELPV